MLDAYIIERIRREREERVRQGSFVPLRIEPPPEPAPREPSRKPIDEGDPPERGSVIIDFTI